jgi:hypothetical protein
MQAPVATTDYLANTLASGAGTNKTADIVVTAVYYGDVVDYSIVNNATTGVYITLLQARGYGIYYGNSIESIIDDTDSQNEYGYMPFQFDMKYQKDTYLADAYGLSVIEEYKYPKSRITKMKYLANLNLNHMMSFLMLSVGALILGVEDRSGISNHYYITDRAFTIKQGGIINVEYGVKQNDSYLSGGLEPVTVEFDGGTGASADAIEFGYLAQVSNDESIARRSFGVWVYLTTIPAAGQAYVIYDSNPQNSIPYFYLQEASPGVTALMVFNTFFTGGQGVWYSDSNFGMNGWHLIGVTYDSTATTNDPIFYIDGVASTSGEVAAPIGTKSSEVGAAFRIGSWKNFASDYTYSFKGKMFDPRVYNKIVSASEWVTLYNAGVPDETLVTDGLVFQGMSVYADKGDADSLAGTTLTSSDRLIDNILRAVGIPHGSPVIRANP